MSDVVFSRPQETKTVTSVFYGLDRGERIPDGYFSDICDMTADKFPCLASRSERKKIIYDSEIVAEGEPVAAIVHNDKILIGCSNGILLYGEKQYECDTGLTDVISFGNMAYCIPSGTLIKDEFSEFIESHVLYRGFWGVKSADEQITVTNSDSSVTNMLFSQDAFYKLREGDAVTVFFSEETGDKNEFSLETHVISVEGADITMEGTLPPDIDASLGLNVTISRTMPTLQYAVAHNNRIWGCFYNGRTNEIYASKLGDPLCWKSYRGLSTDSYAVSCGSEGDFTGCSEIGDAVVFFKENCIYTVYGTEPSDFQTVKTDCFGVQKGSEKSIAKINGQLYYKSCHGIMRLSEGSLPVCISDELGIDRWSDAVGGTDGRKYYIEMTDTEGKRERYCFDTKRSVWHKETVKGKVFSFVNFKNNLLCVSKVSTGQAAKEKVIPKITESDMPKRADYNSKLMYYIALVSYLGIVDTYEKIKDKSDDEIKEYMAEIYNLDVSEITDEMLDAFKNAVAEFISTYKHTVSFSYSTNEAGCNAQLPVTEGISYEMKDEGRFSWRCETGIRGFDASEFKRLKCIELRMKLYAGARCDVSIEYDSSGKWESVGSVTEQGMNMYRIKERLKKCDTYRLRLSGFGKAVIYSIGEIYEEAGNIGF